MSFIDYIIQLEEQGVLIKSAKDLSHLVEKLENEHKFEQAARARNWSDGFKDFIFQEFDDGCMPVKWDEVKEPLPITDTLEYVDSFNRMVGHVEEPEWIAETFGSWMVCVDCGWLIDNPAHVYGCERGRNEN